MNHFENIPMDLKALDQWVIVYGDSKVPIDPVGKRNASSSDPDTWSDFDTCVRCVEKGIGDNIGFVFDGNGFVGIDIDAGYDEDDLISPLAADIIGACHSYTEHSRSGRGFHIILRGTLPFSGRNNRQGVEIYSDSRYFITTGDVLLYHMIEENQSAIDYVLERYFPDALRTSDQQRTAARVYSPLWELPTGGRVKLRPVYPRIPNGCRNICLTSLAGMLHNLGYSPEHIYDELAWANIAACDPSLDNYELESIVKSVTRYKR